MSESLEFGKDLQVTKTNIPGLLIVDLPVHGDSRGWFKENWQREKMVALGLADFKPVQNNISFNAGKGVTRGIHAEPWDKYVSVGGGRIFGAWVDLREGDSFGQTFSIEVDPSKAIFVPRGVGNAFQALEDNTVYTYLVTDHWSQESVPLYTFVNLADETANISWPIPLDQAELSDKDKAHPRLADVTPMKPRKILVTGSNGQLGTALKHTFPGAEFVDREEFDITNPAAYKERNWRQYSTIINAAAYTAVDSAETPEGRAAAWGINATAVRNLARVAADNDITLVHVSSEYVFDGTKSPHVEDEPFTPLGVYAQAKAAGDIAASLTPKHYTVRISWAIGQGNNFVKTMKMLADKGVKPSVVNDQTGRLTFTSTVADAIKHLLDAAAPFGTYNVSNEGDSVSWADIAKEVYSLTGASPEDVTPVTTAEYYRGKENISPRPLSSTMDLSKIKATGFDPTNWRDELSSYIEGLKSTDSTQ
jgi:dTDP-4-dehydrorhamnose 3,5-epimerase